MRIITLLGGIIALLGAGCMALPEGTRVVVTDTPEVWCVVRVNCYHAPTRTIVVVPGASLRTLAHEATHAHQHWTVLDETGREPSKNLHEWSETQEAKDFAVVVKRVGYPDWSLSALTELELFAEANARCLVQDLRFPSQPVYDAWLKDAGVC